MQEILKKDLFRYEGENSHKFLIKLKYVFLVPGYSYTYFFRKSKMGYSKRLFKIFLRLSSYITHIQIPSETKIGEGLYIGHFGDIIIHPEVTIGKNFCVYPGTSIGFTHGKRMGVPAIGDNVFVGRNAVVLGKITIGNNVLIAPGTFVNFDVPDNCIVMGNPGHIIPQDSSPTKKYIVYPVEKYH